MDTSAPVLSSMRKAAWAILVLNLLDITITLLAIHAGAHEANPLAKFLLDTNLIYALKILLPGWVVVSAYWPVLSDNVTELSVRRAWFIAGLYSLVVVLNIFTWMHYA